MTPGACEVLPGLEELTRAQFVGRYFRVRRYAVETECLYAGNLVLGNIQLNGIIVDQDDPRELVLHLLNAVNFGPFSSCEKHLVKARREC